MWSSGCSHGEKDAQERGDVKYILYKRVSQLLRPIYEEKREIYGMLVPVLILIFALIVRKKGDFQGTLLPLESYLLYDCFGVKKKKDNVTCEVKWSSLP